MVHFQQYSKSKHAYEYYPILLPRPYNNLYSVIKKEQCSNLTIIPRNLCRICDFHRMLFIEFVSEFYLKNL